MKYVKIVAKLIIFLLKSIIAILILPIYLAWDVLEPVKTIVSIRKLGLKRSILRFRFRAVYLRIVALVLIIIVVAPTWFLIYYSGYITVRRDLNLVTDQVALTGTGSMYPTFPKGEGKTIEQQTHEIVGTPGMMRYPTGITIYGHSLFTYEIGRGDIVSFSNEKTKEISERDIGRALGFVKRVIALPGDTVEIRGGLLYLNDKPQLEPYIARAHSTFGGTYLGECKKILIPNGKLFVLGDNRKGSSDSRHELGLISYSDVDHVIPLQKQVGVLDKNWRDTSKDLTEESKIRLNVSEYISLLNKKREEAGARDLSHQVLLDSSARLRGLYMLKNDDFSPDASSSGYTMKQAMNDVGYSNITWGEAPTQGYYEADELLENQFAFSNLKSFLLNPDYQEIGIASVEGYVNGCPTQVIVQHLAGYVPPDYPQENIDSINSIIDRLKEIEPGWASLKAYPSFYDDHKGDVDRINEIIDTRITNLTDIVTTMSANEWLSDAQKKQLDEDGDLATEQNDIAKKLNEGN